LKRIVDRLKSIYGAPGAPRAVEPFAIVLYENVAYLASDERRAAAFDELRKRVGLSPVAIARAPLATLRAVARVGGVYPELRSSRMREAARIVIEEFGGDAASAFAEPPPRRRRLLKKFPAIGDPGVDRMLLFRRIEPVAALDSNGLRVLVRVGYGIESKSYSATYRSVQRALGAFTAKDFALLIDAYSLLARHGRELCKRAAPLCEPCPLKQSCVYYSTLA